jgi:hypothetical protein
MKELKGIRGWLLTYTIIQALPVVALIIGVVSFLAFSEEPMGLVNISPVALAFLVLLVFVPASLIWGRGAWVRTFHIVMLGLIVVACVVTLDPYGIAPALWMAYFIKSERVKNTYRTLRTPSGWEYAG